MPAKQCPDTQKWYINDGIPRYHTEESANKAELNWHKRNGTTPPPELLKK
jgi:hypothetical protein